MTLKKVKKITYNKNYIDEFFDHVNIATIL